MSVRAEFDAWAADGRDRGMEDRHWHTAKHVLARMPVEAGETVLDLGTGSGYAARALRAADDAGRAYGLDGSPEMLRNAREYTDDELQSLIERVDAPAIAGDHWSLATTFADLDNDGLRDLVGTNGHRKDLTNLDFIVFGQRAVMMGSRDAIRQRLLDAVKDLDPIRVPNFAFRNRGDLTFEDRRDAWGFARPTISHGLAYADLDRDGDLDLIVNNMDEPARILRNRADRSGAASLRIAFDGPPGNRDGYGASATVWRDGRELELTLTPRRVDEPQPDNSFRSVYRIGVV